VTVIEEILVNPEPPRVLGDPDSVYIVFPKGANVFGHSSPPFPNPFGRLQFFYTTSPKPKEHKDEESKPIFPIDVMAVSKEAEASSVVTTSPLVAR
jgi:hypothetical protein